MYLIVIQSILDCHSVIQSILDCHSVIQSILDCHSVIQSILDCHSVIQSFSQYLIVIQSFSQYLIVIQSFSQYLIVIQSFSHSVNNFMYFQQEHFITFTFHRTAMKNIMTVLLLARSSDMFHVGSFDIIIATNLFSGDFVNDPFHKYILSFTRFRPFVH